MTRPEVACVVEVQAESTWVLSGKLSFDCLGIQ